MHWTKEREEADWGDIKKAHHENALANHPDCRDPDHPGCAECLEIESEEESEGEEVRSPEES